jgi:hypothetical protein
MPNPGLAAAGRLEATEPGLSGWSPARLRLRLAPQNGIRQLTVCPSL